MNFEIKDFRLIAKATTLKATADVTMSQETPTPDGQSAVTVHEVKLVKRGQSLFLSMPTIKRGDRYWPVVTLEDESLKKQIETVLLHMYHQKTGETK